MVPDPLLALQMHSALPVGRIQYHHSADASVISRIRRGVLFVMAWWSGPSVSAFRQLSEVIAILDSQGELEVVVVDTDGCPELYELPEFAGQLHGAGETAWISEGQIRWTSGLGYNPQCFAPNTQALLDCGEPES